MSTPPNAAASGHFKIGGDVEIARLGFGAMRRLIMTLGLALAVTVPVTVPVGGSYIGANVTQCVYKPDLKIIGCRGLTGDLECPAIVDIRGELIYKVFGLGFVPELNNVKSEQVRYWLYPRSLDNVTYVNHTITVDGVVRDIVLYYGDKFVEYGIRVTDIRCFERLVALIKTSTIGEGSSLFGEVLIYDKEVSKRWLWGYGWGLGLGGWGYGGLGYPYGMYGR
jgi:hypothetical protein